MWAWLSQSSFASQAMGWRNIPIVFGNDPNVHSRIIHTLWMPNTCFHDILAGDHFGYNWGYKSLHHLIKRLQTLERLEMLVGVEAGLKNEVTQQARVPQEARILDWTAQLVCLRSHPQWPRSFATIFLLPDSLRFWDTQRALGYL